MSTVFEVHNLVKRYGDLTAVDGIGFDVEQGSCLGLLGPNGAGKSTLVEMMEGVCRPNSGRLCYRGQPIDAHYRQKIGVMFQNTALPEHILVREVLTLFASLYTHSVDLSVLIRQFDLQELLNKPCNRLSGGQRQRLLLAISLINDPEIVFLDEPTTGLDPKMRKLIWNNIRQAKDENKTVVLTTHYMEEAYMLCDTIILMNHGKIVAQGSPNKLLSEQFNSTVLVVPRDSVHDLQQLTDALSGQGAQIRMMTEDPLRIECSDVNVVMTILTELRVDLNHLHIRKKDLEDLFFKLTQ